MRQGIKALILENYVAIDLEMTGLNPKFDRILEIGAVRVIHKKVDAVYQTLVCPHQELSDEVVQLTGITNEMAAENGREMDDVFPEILQFCGDFVLLGHNVVFDYGFLKQAARNRNCEFERDGMDTLKIAGSLLAPQEKKTLQLLCDRYGISREHKHRALDDAKAAMELYELFEAKHEAKYPQLFVPFPLIYKAKKQSAATARQKAHLNALSDYYHIDLQVCVDTLTKNEASRQIDRIIAQYGRMPETKELITKELITKEMKQKKETKK